jgi:alpha-ketoglutarate-dependent taurine dioxygenase
MISTSIDLPTNISCRTLEPFGLLLQDSYIDIRDIAVDVIQRLLLEHRLIVLRSCVPLEHAPLVEYCSRWGELLQWNFGVVFDLVVDEQPTNYLRTAGRVPYHWDGAFIDTVPSIELFQCLTAPSPGSGGETLFCDTTRIWEAASSRQHNQWQQIELIYTTESNGAHYQGQIRVPLVSPHPKTGEARLRYGEPFDSESQELTRLSMEIKGLPQEQHEAFLQEMQSLLYSPQYCYVHQWQNGDIVIGDNHILLHARNKFAASTPRHLQRVHIV